MSSILVYVHVSVDANNVEAVEKELGVDAVTNSNGIHSELLRVPRVMFIINSRERKNHLCLSRYRDTSELKDIIIFTLESALVKE